MKPILSIGETQEEYDLGITEEVCAMQVSKDLAGVSKKDLANVVLAYEPVWAIGTGKVPTTSQIGEVHSYIRAALITRFGNEIGSAIRLLYGGSVKVSNAAEIFAVGDVDGALVGGASLKAGDFAPIVEALNAA